jgi:hypothetical protein
LNHKRLPARYRNFIVRELYRRVSGRSRPLINPLFTQFESVLFCFFFAVKDRPFNTFDLYNGAEAAWAQDNALRVPVKSGCKRLALLNQGSRNPCIAPCPNTWPWNGYTENTFRCQPVSRTTFLGSLSSLKPMNFECLRWPNGSQEKLEKLSLLAQVFAAPVKD